MQQARKPLYLGVCLTCLYLLPLGVHPASDVIELTDENFDELVAEGPWFVKIYAPWCSHCRKVKPIWETVATSLKKHGIKVGNIDATQQKLLTARFEPVGFPSFYHLVSGECREYQHLRTPDKLVEFALEGWQNAPPMPFYKAPNSSVGRLLGHFRALPSKFRVVYDWLHQDWGLSDLAILLFFLAIPVSMGLGVICMLDLMNSRQAPPRSHAD